MSKTTRTTQQMYPLVERYLQANKTQKAFCREHGLSTSVLCYWLAKYRRQLSQRPSAFVEIAPDPTPTEGLLLEVLSPQGLRLRLFSLVEPAYLARLLRIRP